MSIFGKRIENDGSGVLAMEFNNELEADKAVEALKSCGIPAYKRADGANQLMNFFLGNNIKHPVSVFVAREQRDEARDLLTAMGFGVDKINSDNVRLMTHTAVRLKMGGKVLYCDPYNLRENPHDADLIMVTHPHHDHYSPEDIAKVAGANTRYLSPKSID